MSPPRILLRPRPSPAEWSTLQPHLIWEELCLPSDHRGSKMPFWDLLDRVGLRASSTPGSALTPSLISPRAATTQPLATMQEIRRIIPVLPEAITPPWDTAPSSGLVLSRM